MMPKARIWLIAGLLFLVSGLLQASYLESDYPSEAPPPHRIIPPPTPVPTDPLADMVGWLSVGRAYHYKGLTVFPVELSRVTDPEAYLSVGQALAARVLTVTEKEAGTVPTLIVENLGREPILMLGGELLLGGKQNRILREDVLLQPRSGRIEVPVLCGEQGRWSGRSERFEGLESVAPLAVRGSAQAGRSQEEIWAGVRHYQARLQVESETGDLQEVQDSPDVRKALADYRAHFEEHCWRPPHVGMVVARHGRVVGADIFCNAAMFRMHRDRLLASYTVDCLAHRQDERAVVYPARTAALQFLQRVLRAQHAWRKTPGAGRLLAVSGAGLTGSALVYRDNVLHACLFPESELLVRPSPPVRIPEIPPGPRPMR